MSLTEEERKALEIISKRHLITRSELIDLLKQQTNGASLFVVNNLIDKGLVSKISGFTAENSFVITKMGMQFLKHE